MPPRPLFTSPTSSLNSRLPLTWDVLFQWISHHPQCHRHVRRKYLSHSAASRSDKLAHQQQQQQPELSQKQQTPRYPRLEDTPVTFTDISASAPVISVDISELNVPVSPPDPVFDPTSSFYDPWQSPVTRKLSKFHVRNGRFFEAERKRMAELQRLEAIREHNQQISITYNESALVLKKFYKILNQATSLQTITSKSIQSDRIMEAYEHYSTFRKLTASLKEMLNVTTSTAPVSPSLPLTLANTVAMELYETRSNASLFNNGENNISNDVPLPDSRTAFMIPIRITRKMFVMLSREVKSPELTEILLCIALDLVNDRRLNHSRDDYLPSSIQKRRSLAAATAATTSATFKRTATNTSSLSPTVIDTSVGLLPSEYTILMNHVGTTLATLSTPNADTVVDPMNQESTTTTTNSEMAMDANDSVLDSRNEWSIGDKSTTTNRDTPSVSPVDRAWAFWQHFLTTGMQPDIVMCTTMLDISLKAKDFARADEIWNLISSNGVNLQGDQNMDKRTGNQNESSDITSAVLDSTSSSKSSTSSPNSTSFRKRPIGPNIYTFSILMDTYARQGDVMGVMQVYQEMKRLATGPVSSPPLPVSLSSHVPASTVATAATAGATTNRKESAAKLPPVFSNISTSLAFNQQRGNSRGRSKDDEIPMTTFLNQMLAYFVKLSEKESAKAIYNDMRQYQLAKGANNNIKKKNEESPDSRADEISVTAAGEVTDIDTRDEISYRNRSNSNDSGDDNSRFWLAGPDATTMHIMMRLAIRSKDRKLKELIFNDIETFGKRTKSFDW